MGTREQLIEILHTSTGLIADRDHTIVLFTTLPAPLVGLQTWLYLSLFLGALAIPLIFRSSCMRTLVI